jgi:hypothetical protein
VFVPGCYRCSNMFFIEMFSVQIRARKKARFWTVLRVIVPCPERYANSLSERRTLSGTWGLVGLVYRLFSLHRLHHSIAEQGKWLKGVLGCESAPK